MPQKWYSGDHVGSNFTVLGTDWTSFTMDRPVARLALNGKRPFVVKKVAWKCCAAPSTGQKMYGRISTADGSVYDNSYIGNTISWQKAASVLYEFQAINLHFDDDGGQRIRSWLVSGGPFYYATGGGSPIGYITYAEVALPPAGLAVARDATDANKVTFSWTQWDIKNDVDACGGSTSLMGYCVQAARDPGFTEQVRLAYVSKGTGELYGLYKGFDWYFRIATRNEVSEKYKLPGGQWSTAVKLAADVTAPATPSATGGIGTGATDAGSNTDTAGSSGSAAANNPNASSNAGGASVVTTTSTTYTVTETVTDTKVKQAKDQVAAQLPTLAAGATAAHTAVSNPAWTNLANQLAASITLATAIRDALASGSLKTAWTSLIASMTAASTKVTKAATTAAGTQSADQQLDVALAQALDAQRTLAAVLLASAQANTASGWRTAADSLDYLALVAGRAANLSAGSTKTAWTAVQTKGTAASSAMRLALMQMKAADIEAARQLALLVSTQALAAYTASVAPTTDYSAAEAAVTQLVSDLTDLLKLTPEQKQVTRTVTVPAGTVIPSDSNGTGGTGTAGGSTPTTTTVTNADGTTTTTIVYTPIPDTTATRTASGGLLLSQISPVAPGHTVYLMDRGGRARLGQFKSPTKIEYNRIRDDQSMAFITLSGLSITKNAAVLDSLAVGRHEICIFRGSERVWEGPVTLATFKGSEVVLRATDITHYLNRTVLKRAYSNAYPALDYCVSRIAGIIASELATKEAIDPPVNILPFMRTYVQDGDARTTRTSLAAEATVWGHLDDLAAKAGIDYTVIGRALHIWDTSRPALGRLRKVTEVDFLGEPYIAAYGMETATQTFVSDGQGNFGQAGGVDDFYGEIDLLATAFDENGNAIDQTDLDPTNDTIPIAEMTEQAVRNLKGRNPTPLGLKVPDGSSFRTDRGISVDVLIPGVYIPVTATLAGRTMDQMMKLKEVKVVQDDKGETVAITVTPAAESDEDNTLEDE